MTGTKFGCGIAQCGACTVHLDGVAIRSCQLPAGAIGDRAVTTIEGVGQTVAGAKIQKAWLDLEVIQCGYCQPGQIMSAAALLTQNAAPDDADIDAAMAGGVGDWSVDDLAAYVKSGHAHGRGSASGPMGEAVDLSLSKLTRSDLEAIATYVRSVKPIFSEGLPKPAGAAADSPKIAALDNERGKRVFEGNCESCHAWTGAGAIVQAAQLTGDRAINDASATNVIQVILSGSGSADGGRPYMPSFADAYSDAEIAAVANYVTARFGAKPSQATPAEVGRLRAQR